MLSQNDLLTQLSTVVMASIDRYFVENNVIRRIETLEEKRSKRSNTQQEGILIVRDAKMLVRIYITI